MPSLTSFMPVTLVFSHTASQIASIRLARMLTRSRSAPGSRPAGHLDDGDLACRARRRRCPARARCSRRRRRAAISGMSGRSSAPVESISARARRSTAPGSSSAREPVAMMQCSKVSVSFVPSTLLDVERVRVAERRPCPGGAGSCAGCGPGRRRTVSCADDLVLEVAQLVEIDLRLRELDAEVVRVRRLGDDVGDVQQRLGRNAPAIDAHAARVLLRIDERDLHPAVGRVERRRVSAGAGADDDQLCRIGMRSLTRYRSQESRNELLQDKSNS